MLTLNIYLSKRLSFSNILRLVRFMMLVCSHLSSHLNTFLENLLKILATSNLLKVFSLYKGLTMFGFCLFDDLICINNSKNDGLM